MKLTDFLHDIGRPVAYYPELRRITGSVTATILLCQFIYWRGKESGGDGWLYKTADEITEETGLSYNEQKTARRDLIQAGLLEEHYARLDHQMRFRLNLDAINSKWGTAETIIPESDKVTFGNDDIQRSLNESENTAENTTSIEKFQNQPTPDNYPLDWYLSHNLAVPENWKDPSGDAQRNEFERSLGFGKLPWDTGDFEKLSKWVITIYNQDKTAFQRYAEWRTGDGKYNAMNNKQIRMNPKMFIDTGWPTYLAHISMNQSKKSKGFAL